MQAKIVKVEQTHSSSIRPYSSWLTITIASLSGLLTSLDSSVNIAFPAKSTAIQLDVSRIQWVVISYVLTYASVLLGCGRLADLVGHGWVLRWGLFCSLLI
jgi:MFS family permease